MDKFQKLAEAFEAQRAVHAERGAEHARESEALHARIAELAAPRNSPSEVSARETVEDPVRDDAKVVEVAAAARMLSRDHSRT